MGGSINSEISKKREKKLLLLYQEVFPMLARFVNKRGGSLDQAKDIFHDALVIWYEKSEGGNDDFVSSDKAYIYGIGRHLWFRDFTVDNKLKGFDDSMENDFVDSTELQPSNSGLMALLEKSGKKCMDLLKSFYYDKLSMSQLAAGFGFRSERSATVQKYKCLEKVRDTVKEKALHYEDFLE